MRISIDEALKIAEENARVERETPSLVAADSPERYASWASTVELLRVMKERGVPASMPDQGKS